MKTVQDAFRLFNDTLIPLYEKSEADAISKLAIGNISGLNSAQLKAFPEKPLSIQQFDQLSEIAVQLKTGNPIQYILGHTEFYNLPFKVNPSVLIPRPETEELVHWVIQSIKERNIKENILDIGTGSGCIPIALKKHLPDADISAIDISTEALKTARQNACLNQVEVNFIERDILLDDSSWNVKKVDSPLTTDHSVRQVDSAGTKDDSEPEVHSSSFNNHELSTIDHGLSTIGHGLLTTIISNPPYVTGLEKGSMHRNVLGFEPHNALFVPDDDPLLFYRAIAGFALKHLVNGGQLFLEINENFGQQTVDLLADKSFTHIQLRQDMRGKDRMIRATLPSSLSHAGGIQ